MNTEIKKTDKKTGLASALKAQNLSTLLISVVTIAGLAAAVLVMLFGGNERLALALALFAFVAPVISALIKIDEVHVLTNSTLTKLLAEVDALKKQLVVEQAKTTDGDTSTVATPMIIPE